ncbi:MAG: FAD-dependent oxidoreductase [Saprospiraceae bacterium]
MNKQVLKKSNSNVTIAIIGGGVSGLSLAYFLQSKHIDFVLFERESRLGGNAHTRKIVHNNKEKCVDMAVNDFNPKTYSKLSNLLEKTNSSTGQVKVNTTFFSTNSFLFKESELKDAELVENIDRFKKEAVEVLINKTFRWYSVKEYFEEKGYSPKFLTQYLYPRIQGLFFYPPEGLESLPVSFVMNFYSLQCGFKHNKIPSAVRFNFKNGASSWIENLAKAIPSQNIIKSESPQIEKTDVGFKIQYSNGEVFADKVVFACHADDLYNHYSEMLSEKQNQIISKIKYAKMLSVAHCDINYLPVNRADFSAYNCLVKDPSEDKNTHYTITYNCNEHQNLSNGGKNSDGDDDYFFVTVNPIQKIEEKYILKDTNGLPLIKEFSRNICDFDLLRSQKQLKLHQGKNNIYFVGGYTNGIGLHENCLIQSAIIAKKIHEQRKLLPLTH